MFTSCQFHIYYGIKNTVNIAAIVTILVLIYCFDLFTSIKSLFFRSRTKQSAKQFTHFKDRIFKLLPICLINNGNGILHQHRNFN